MPFHLLTLKGGAVKGWGGGWGLLPFPPEGKEAAGDAGDTQDISSGVSRTSGFTSSLLLNKPFP